MKAERTSAVEIWEDPAVSARAGGMRVRRPEEISACSAERTVRWAEGKVEGAALMEA